jgi:hypothetical protein
MTGFMQFVLAFIVGFCGSRVYYLIFERSNDSAGA